MKQQFIVKKDYPELLIFFAGWGMDENPFKEYRPLRKDFMICYDYTSLDFNYYMTTSYSSISIVAWSMGVWAASKVLDKKNLPLASCVAVNGTPYPVDDHKGIPVAVFMGTLNGLNEVSLRKFQRRMCGSNTLLENFLNKSPQRTIEDLKNELQAIGEQAINLSFSSLIWNKAYISDKDKIFVPGNQVKAWTETDTTIVDGEHYSEDLWKKLLR